METQAKPACYTDRPALGTHRLLKKICSSRYRTEIAVNVKAQTYDARFHVVRHAIYQLKEIGYLASQKLNLLC